MRYQHFNMDTFLKVTISVMFTLPVSYATELPAWHMKPIGSHTEPVPIDETDVNNLISPADFAKNYVLPRKPIIFRGIAKTWPAFTLWTDDYLTENYGDMEVRLESKKEKKGKIPKGNVCLGRDTIGKFISDYQKGADKYIVSDLPTSMYKEVHIPLPMACGEFLQKFIEINLWVNSDIGRKGNGGNSILHKDEYNTFNCLLNGTKEWRLFDLRFNDYLYQSWEPPLDAGYGGFSLINPNKVDAKEYPDVSKISEWHFVTVHAGDCIHVPTQMWHSVKSYGPANKAVALLFHNFEDVENINTTDCETTQHHIPLSDVDVDWPYPGNGVMPMGNDNLDSFRMGMVDLVDEKVGYVTKQKTHLTVHNGHIYGQVNKKLILEKTRTLYSYLLDAAGGEKENMTYKLMDNLSRDQLRFCHNLLNPVEPSSSYNYEYAALLPEQITKLIETLKDENQGKIERDTFMNAYQKMGGTEKFGAGFWERLAGDKSSVEEIKETLAEALRPYEENRKDWVDLDEAIPGNDTVLTPSGHYTQPKSRRGYYERVEDTVEDEESSGEGQNDENITDSMEKKSGTKEEL